MIKISFVGDINPGGVLTYTGGVSSEVKDLLGKSDLRIGTLECALGDGSTPCQIKMADPNNGTIIYAPDDSVHLLKKLQIDVVSLANNHSFDLGIKGFNHTVKLLENAGIKYVGAGNNIHEASKPLILNIEGKTICVIAYLEKRIPCIRLATATKAGANPFELKKAISDIKKYKSIYDYVIILPHWGKENSLCPRIDIVKWCQKLADAGADAIIASHTHILQPIFKRRNTIIAYSMGNFLFPDRFIDSPRKTVYPDIVLRTQANIPKVNGFPIVDELSFKVISQDARIGGVLLSSFDCESNSNSYLLTNTYLNEKNELIIKNMPYNYARDYRQIQLFSRSVIGLKLYYYARTTKRIVSRLFPFAFKKKNFQTT